eukprot:326815_1
MANNNSVSTNVMDNDTSIQDSKDDFDIDDAVQEVLVNKQDLREEAFTFSDVIENTNILKCIGKIVSNFKNSSGKTFSMRGTGTVFKVKNGNAYILTAAHNLRFTEHWNCVNCQQQNKTRKCDLCGSKITSNAHILKAGKIYFHRKTLKGNLERKYKCDIVRIEDNLYEKFPFPAAGYDYAILKFPDVLGYYEKTCVNIMLINGHKFNDAIKRKKNSYYIFGYPAFVKNKERDNIWGAESIDDEFTIKKHQKTECFYLTQNEIDASKGASGAAIFSIYEINNVHYTVIFGLHTGGKGDNIQYKNGAYNIGVLLDDKFNAEYDKGLVLSSMQIPRTFLDPITNRIMTDPVQILKSGVIYDAVTVQYLQCLPSNIDPITGVLISSGKEKPVVMRKDKLQLAIDRFRKANIILPELINTVEHVNNAQLWEVAWQRLHDKYDIKKQQQLIYKKSMQIFYSKTECKTDLLQCGSDLMYINHTSVPIVTFMGPSKTGKSFLLNAILKNKFKDLEMHQMNHEIFQTSNQPDRLCTEGAWISLYGDIDDTEDAKNNDEFILIDQWPEDDVEMWSTNEIISWLKSLNPKFSNLYKNVSEFIQKKKIDGKQFYKLNNIELLRNQLKMDQNHAFSLANVVGKRLRQRPDEIEAQKVTNMYLVDMQGLTHGVTEFTKQLFVACYTISNVVIWYDNQVMTDSFRQWMRFYKNMQAISHSNRKPSFLYLLRNADLCYFDFDCDSKDDKTDENDFDKWINNHQCCRWLHDLNIFSSIHGYLLDSPTLERKTNKKTLRYYKQNTLNGLINKIIKSLTHKTARYA